MGDRRLKFGRLKPASPPFERFNYVQIKIALNMIWITNCGDCRSSHDPNCHEMNELNAATRHSLLLRVSTDRCDNVYPRRVHLVTVKLNVLFSS